MKPFEVSQDIEKCLQGDNLAWTRLAAWINTALNVYCRQWLAGRGIQDLCRADDACAAVLESLLDETQGRLRTYASVGTQAPTRALFFHYLSHLARAELRQQLRSESRLHRRERQAARTNLEPTSITEQQIITALASAFGLVSQSHVRAFWYYALHDMPRMQRAQPMSGADRQRRSRLLVEFRRWLVEGKIGADM